MPRAGARLPGQWATRLSQLSQRAETVLDTVRALAQDSPDERFAEALAWARAVASSVGSHARDFEETRCWTRFLPGGAGESRDLPAAAAAMLERLDREDPALEALPDVYEAAAEEVEALGAGGGAAVTATLAGELRQCAAKVAGLTRRLTELSRLASRLVEEMDFTFLFDQERKLFSIGYNLSDGRLDPGYYDLLASEARLASFIAIARGDVPASHWFRLGRSLTPVGKGSALISWSGSMFEYLMPELVMKAPAGSLLEHTTRLIVERQIRYGEERGVPWGVSESAFNAQDLNFTYQYSNFGVSGLGLKRGLSEDLVVAPYATALAAMVDPAAAVAQPPAPGRGRRARGPTGSTKASTTPPSRLREGEKSAIVQAVMAHHQGMTVVALDNV